MRAHFPPCTLHHSEMHSPLSSALRHRLPVRRFVLPLALAVALAGCSSTFQWVKDGFAASHADARFAACQLEAERLLYSSAESEEDRAARIRHESHLCMQADGWRWTESDGQGSDDQLGTSSSSSSAGQTPKRTSEAGSAQASEESSASPSDQAKDKSSDGADDNKAAKAGDQTDDDDDDDDDDDE